MQSTQVNGLQAMLAVKEPFFIQTETYMRANGSITRQMDMELITIKKVLAIRDNGKMTFNQVKVLKCGLTGANISECTKMEINKAKVNIFGMMDQYMMEIGTKM